MRADPIPQSPEPPQQIAGTPRSRKSPRPVTTVPEPRPFSSVSPSRSNWVDLFVFRLNRRAAQQPSSPLHSPVQQRRPSLATALPSLAAAAR
ncbi:hypothetical protein CRG98_050073 [Punica granatum]|uniref:Uncharacterized protein n=1 Tax=Punica granatum TaxID=22663 RepID=A0A2I0GTJ8_PUNGR|nr:hypothetical protein CRG98_050073 [Punica granatum]